MEFVNTVIVDTSSAVADLTKLDRATEAATASMGEFQAVAGRGINAKGFQETAAAADRLGKSGAAGLKRVGQESTKAGKSIKAMGLSYKDVGRIVESQIIFAAISKVTQGFFEAADAAAEFQEQIARIAAIDEEQLGFTELRSQIEELAIELGRPLEEVGSAAFEALQNDLGTTGDTMDILRGDAQRLALVTGGDLGQAVNALSSVYKTFGTNLEDVDSISGQFFGTINAGRITLKDLESSLGTLSPLAIQLDVGFKELTDSLATITLTGTKANVATTQLRNVFNKLIKPTEALQKVYQDLGVKGFRELSNQIGEDGKKRGLIGSLQVLQEAVKGDEDGLSRLFNTIRANVGVLNILTENGKLYADTADRSAESATRLGEAIENIDSTAAREAAKNSAELEVIFTRLGDSALDVKNAVTNAFLALVNGSEEGVIAVSALTLGIGGATIAWAKFGVAAAVAFPPVIAFLAVAGAGVAALKGIEEVAKSTFKLARATATLEVERMEAFVKTLKELRAGEIKEAADALANTGTVLNTIAGKAKETGDAIKAIFDVDAGKIAAVEATLLDAFGDARTRVLAQVEKAIKDIDKQILDGIKKIKGFQQDLKDVSFEFKIEGLDKAEQAAQRLTRSAEQTALAFTVASKAGLSEESQETARTAAKVAVSYAEAALSAARTAGNAQQIKEAQAGVQSAITSQIAVERQLIGLREGLGKKQLIEQQQAFEQLSATAKEQVQDVLNARKAIADAAGRGAGKEETNKLKDALVKETDEARKALVAAGQAEVLKTFDLEGQVADAITQLESGLASTQIDWTETIGQLREDLASATDLKAAVAITLKIDELAGESGSDVLAKAVKDAQAKGGLPGDQLENSSKAVLDVFKEQKALSDTVEDSSVKAQAAADKARLAFAEATTEFNSGSGEALKLVDPVLAKLSQLGDLNKEQLTALIENLKAALPAIAEQSTGLFGTFTEEQKANLTEGIKAAINAATATAEGLEARKLFDPENLAAAKSVLDQISSTDLRDLGLEVDSEGFEDVAVALNEIKRQAILSKENVKAIGTVAGTFVVQGINAVTNSTNGMKQAGENAKSTYRDLLSIAKEALAVAKEAASINASNKNANLFNGGRPKYRADGGASRGTDTVPAMLDPEEFVMNSKSSREFFPQLNAINAGNSPSSTGNSVGDTNVTIGDINVSSSSDVPSQTAREIASSIKRELRRGTSRL